MAPNRYTVVLAAALLTAGAATYGVSRVMQREEARHQIPLRPVVVASRDVPEGVALEHVALELRRWPSAAVPQDAFASPDSVVGRVTRVPVFTGEAIVPGRLAPLGTGTGVQVKITPGKRAMAVKIDDVAGVSGLIQPDSRVDVLVTVHDAQATGAQVAKLFMANMRVLAVGTVDRSGPENRPITASTVTLEVSPDEAERLAVAAREGTIQLVLRGYGDPDAIKTPGARTIDVLAQLREAPVVRAEARTLVRRVRREVPHAPPPPPPVAPAPLPAPPPPPSPKVPDSLSVQVFRGDRVTQHKFEKRDSTKQKPDIP